MKPAGKEYNSRNTLLPPEMSRGGSAARRHRVVEKKICKLQPVCTAE
jgi:hypothetical protein